MVRWVDAMFGGRVHTAYLFCSHVTDRRASLDADSVVSLSTLDRQSLENDPILFFSTTILLTMPSVDQRAPSQVFDSLDVDLVAKVLVQTVFS